MVDDEELSFGRGDRERIREQLERADHRVADPESRNDADANVVTRPQAPEVLAALGQLIDELAETTAEPQSPAP